MRLGHRHEGCLECDWTAHLEHAEWNAAARNETEAQRVDRNFTELLQELRVAQTGVQILFAFLLGLSFTPRFAQLSRAEHALYVATLALSAASAAFLIAPVSYHRLVFRRRLKARLVQTSHRLALIGLALLLLAVVGAVDLAAGLVLGPWAALLSGALALLFGGLWYVLPLVERAHHTHVPAPVAESRGALD
jgi:hypothetical protein